ncbi:hypothetical protein Taro_007901 [Colocasia esculenta]|uniref:DNA replication complex GINS protein PSF3 n=1 Tax=Colocasia esculenta TaxID=4460 RepID=A0A843TVL1_COLES|nr:hypothetical protein [Colocasia esculenta]
MRYSSSALHIAVGTSESQIRTCPTVHPSRRQQDLTLHYSSALQSAFTLVGNSNQGAALPELGFQICVYLSTASLDLSTGPHPVRHYPHGEVIAECSSVRWRPLEDPSWISVKNDLHELCDMFATALQKMVYEIDPALGVKCKEQQQVVIYEADGTLADKYEIEMRAWSELQDLHNGQATPRNILLEAPSLLRSSCWFTSTAMVDFEFTLGDFDVMCPPPLLGLASTRLTSAPSSSAAALPRWYPRRRRRPASGLVNFDKEVMARYYNIHDIIMEEEPISVIFQVGANGVGLLDPGSETNSVEKGAKVDLPFWLSHELYLRQAVSINVPSCFSQKTRKEVQADAACVDLRSRCPYFYELGCKIVPIATDKSIGSFVHYAFTSRYKEILSKSHSAPVSTAPKFLAHLTNEESQLFEAARSSMASFKKWRVGGSRLEKASILGRKRKTTISQHSSTE